MDISSIFTRCLAGAVVVLSLVSGCGENEKPQGPLEVAAGLPPVAFLAERIGGETVSGSTMLPEGRSPHD